VFCYVCDECSWEDVDDEDAPEARLRKTSASKHRTDEEYDQQTSALTADEQSTDADRCHGGARDQTGSHVTGSHVEARADGSGGNVDVHVEKVFVQSLASSIGKFSIALNSVCVCANSPCHHSRDAS